MENKEQKKPRVRPKVTHGFTVCVKTGCGKMYVTVNEDELGPCEVFTQLGKCGGCSGSQAEAISRLVSLGLRSGNDINEVEYQLKGIRCPSPEGVQCQPVEGVGKIDDPRVLSCADGISKAIKEYLVLRPQYRSENLVITGPAEINKSLVAMNAGQPAPEAVAVGS